MCVSQFQRSVFYRSLQGAEEASPPSEVKARSLVREATTTLTLQASPDSKRKGELSLESEGR